MTTATDPTHRGLTTFVTAFVQIYGSNNEQIFGGRDSAWRYAHFRTLAESGVPLCVYVDIEEYARMIDFAKEFDNIHVLLTPPLSETWAHEVYQTTTDNTDIVITLPEQAHVDKDTQSYLLLIMAKTEWVAEVARSNPWNTPQFAWIDFSIGYVLHDIPRCQSELQRIARTVLPPKTLYIPGCSPYPHPLPAHVAQLSADELRAECPTILEGPYWRFCGGLFVGDTASILEFDELSRTFFGSFLCKYRRLVWEVNFWAWLESAVPAWTPIWYNADHNDTMITDFPI